MTQIYTVESKQYRRRLNCAGLSSEEECVILRRSGVALVEGWLKSALSFLSSANFANASNTLAEGAFKNGEIRGETRNLLRDIWLEYALLSDMFTCSPEDQFSLIDWLNCW